ncbi:MAG: phosphatase PAP2 family protein [Ilumatobacteraceae bacterium]
MHSPVPLPPRDRLRWLGLVLYGLVFVVAVRSWGIPFERPILLAWLMGAAAIATIGRRGGGPVAVLRDWLPYGLALTAYDFTRGAADDLGMPVQVRLPIDLDRILGLGHVPTVVLQRWLGGFDGPVAWWEVPMALVYTSHFVAPFVIPAVLWVRNRDRFAAWRDRFFTVVGLGLITYTLVPVAPPWMAARRRAAAGRAGRDAGWSRLGLHVAQSVFDFGNRTVNVVAALPSLHAAFAAITAVFFWRSVRPWARPLLAAYPLFMAFTLVAGGEHYLTDIVLAWIYVAVAFVVWNRLDPRTKGDQPGSVVAPSDDRVLTGSLVSDSVSADTSA